MHEIIMIFIPDADEYEALKQHYGTIADFSHVNRPAHNVWNFPHNILSLDCSETISTVMRETATYGIATYKVSGEVVNELLLLPTVESSIEYIKSNCRREFLDV